MRKTFLILGALLAFVFGIGIFLFLQVTRPVVVEVPVAVNDIPAGTALKSGLFRVAQFSNADPGTVAQWVTVNTWNNANGKVTNSDIRAGFPVAKSQIDPNISSQVESRLSMVLTQTDQYYFVIPVKPDEVGNFIQPGDRVDVILSLGDAGGKDAMAVLAQSQQQSNAATGGDAQVAARNEVTLTSPMPVSKLVMQNMTVLRIERNTPSSGTASQQQVGEGQPTPVPVTSYDVKRLYVRVDKDQLEVLSFVLNNGKHNYAVRAANGSQESLPTDGVLWADFVRWFYAQRGNPTDAQPFNAISPSTQNTAER